MSRDRAAPPPGSGGDVARSTPWAARRERGGEQGGGSEQRSHAAPTLARARIASPGLRVRPHRGQIGGHRRGRRSALTLRARAPRPLPVAPARLPSAPTRWRPARGLASAALASATAFALAIAGGGGGDGASPDDPTATPAPEPLFRALEADLVATCGGKNGQCHVKGSYQEAPAWLAGPDPYVSARRYPGVLPATRDVNDSILLTQVAHAGPALATHEALSGACSMAERGGPARAPTSGAFSVQSGFNAVDPRRSPRAMGARLEMLATERSAGVLELTARASTPPNAGIRVTSPFFVLLPERRGRRTRRSTASKALDVPRAPPSRSTRAP